MKYQIKGITDSKTDCECCGRSDLKATVVLESEIGEIGYFGKVCAAKLLKIGSKEVVVVANQAKKAAQKAARVEFLQHPLHKKLDQLLSQTEGQGWKARLWFLDAINPHLILIRRALLNKYCIECF